MGFALSNFLLGILYMFESFRYCMDGSFEYGALNRVLDISLFVCQGYMWVMFLNFYIKDRNPLCIALKKYALPVCALTLAVSIVAYIWFFDKNFFAVGTAGYVMQLVIASVMSVYTVLCTIEIGKFEEVEKNLIMANALLPEDNRILYEFAFELLRQEKKEEAIEMFKEILIYNPDDEEVAGLISSLN